MKICHVLPLSHIILGIWDFFIFFNSLSNVLSCFCLHLFRSFANWWLVCVLHVFICVSGGQQALISL